MLLYRVCIESLLEVLDESWPWHGIHHYFLRRSFAKDPSTNLCNKLGNVQPGTLLICVQTQSTLLVLQDVVYFSWRNNNHRTCPYLPEILSNLCNRIRPILLAVHHNRKLHLHSYTRQQTPHTQHHTLVRLFVRQVTS